MTLEPDAAAEALAAMRRSREALAALAGCPPERHAAFALLIGGLVAAQAAPPMFTLLIEFLLMVGVGLVVIWDRRRTGMFINGYRAGRTRPMTFALLAVALALGGLGVWLKLRFGLIWAPVACGLAVAAAAFVMSLAWQRIYRRELAETP